MQKESGVIEIDVIELLKFYLRRWYVFLLAMAITLAAGMAICLFFVTPQYESTTKIIILSKETTGQLTYSDLQLSGQLTKDYEELITSRDVLEAVIRKCGLSDDYEELKKRIKTENVPDTRIISISVEDPSPQMAQRIADSVRDTAAEHIRAMTDVEAVNVAEQANLPTEQSFPSVLLWAVISALVGFVIVLIIRTAQFLSDDSIKSSEDVERYLGLTTLALIPKVDEGSSKGKGKRGRKKAYGA